MVCAKRGWLAGANLGPVDWSGADLKDAKLMGANLRGANLANADLSKVNTRPPCRDEMLIAGGPDGR